MSRAIPAVLTGVVTVALAATLLIPAGLALSGVPVRASSLSPRALAPAISGIGLPYTTGMPATLALGQANLVSGGPGHGSRNLTFPYAAAFDSAGDLWVVDTADNRVLEYVPPFSTGMSATLAVGQTSLSGWLSNTTRNGLWEPQGIAFDSSGDLWVADSTNNRILEFTPPFHTGMNASLVLGQSIFLTRGSGTTATNLTHPTGLAFNGTGDLVVADTVNNRVLVFDPPFKTGMSASLVIGQNTFTASGAATTSTNLSAPRDVTVGPSGAIWVADSGNNRVLEFVPPFSSGMRAHEVVGQNSSTSRSTGAAWQLNDPVGLTFDTLGNLWVADIGNNEVIEWYVPPTVTNGTPMVVLGQSVVTGIGRSGTTAVNLSSPTLPAVDRAGDMWVVDSGNSRVVEYVPTEFAVTALETGLPSGTAWSVTFNGVVGSAVAPGTITFNVWNGTYPFSPGTVPGYSASPTSGYEPVDGQAVNFTIAYASTSTSSGSSTGLLNFLWIVFLIVAVILLILYLSERRRRRATRAQAPSGGTPPGATGSPATAPGGPTPPSSGGPGPG